MKKKTVAVSPSAAIATARFTRRAAGRIGKREAAELGLRYGDDIHWKYLGKDGDKLAQRKPGDFARSWADQRFGDCIALAFKRESRAPKRGHGRLSPDACEIARRLAYLFCWYGPSNGMWPGDILVFNLEAQFGPAWVVQCAPDCPCGRCYRATSPGLARASARHAEAAGVSCVDTGDGTCGVCGVALVDCSDCEGRGYHRPACVAA